MSLLWLLGENKYFILQMNIHSGLHLLLFSCLTNILFIMRSLGTVTMVPENWSTEICKSYNKNGVFWDVMPCGSCKNRRFRGT
jgi:hypothetical protein